MTLPRPAVLLTLLFLLAFGVRVALVAAVEGLDAPPDIVAMPDSEEYEAIAWELAQGHGYRFEGEATAVRPPGTSLSLAPVYALSGRSYLAARLWICFLSAASVLFAGLLAGRAFGAPAGALTALILCFEPTHVYAALHFLSETPFLAVATLGMLLSLVALDREEPSRAFGVLAGLAYGAAALCRPQLVLAIPLGLLAALLGARRIGARRLRNVALQAAVMLMAIAPWVLRNASVIGEPKLATIGGVTFWGAHNDVVHGSGRVGGWVAVDGLAPEGWQEATEVERDAIAWSEGIDWARGNAAEMPLLVLRKLGRMYSPFHETDNGLVRAAFAAGWFLLMPLSFAGLVVAFRRHRIAGGILLVHVAVLTVTAAVFYGDVRFRSCGATVFAAWAAVSLVSLLPPRAGGGEERDVVLAPKARRKAPGAAAAAASCDGDRASALIASDRARD